MEDKLSDSMKKRSRSPNEDLQQGEKEAKRDDGLSRTRPTLYRDREANGQMESYSSSTGNSDLMAEYRLLLARQDALNEQIRLVESMLSIRRMEATLGTGLSSRDGADRGAYSNDNLILERAREDLLRRDRQGLMESGRFPCGPAGAESLRRLVQEQRDRDLLLARLSANSGQGLPDRLLSSDPSRRSNMQSGGLPLAMESLDDLLAARSRAAAERYPALLQGSGLPRSRLEEASGRGSPQRQTALSPPRFEPDALGPGDQLHILQQIERQRRINESLLDQARSRDLGSVRPPAATSHGTQLRDMRGTPATRDFKAGVPMAAESDCEKLSAFQALIRRSLEYFEATDDDVLTSVQGRRQKIRLGQIGVRCKYCSHLPIRSMARAKGAVYYPKTMISVYQAAQNIANSHFLVPCNFMPEEIQKELAIQRPKRDASLAGKPYWTKTCQELGIYEDDDALWNRESKKNPTRERLL